MVNLKKCILFVSVVLLAGCMDGGAGNPAGPSDGEVQTLENGTQEAWNAETQTWVGLAAFWDQYAERRGGYTWGVREDYPPYAEVEEFDTMLVQLDSGPCMMMFFHSRWRRANDVRRWDDAFNEYGGCPYVFD